MKKNAFTLIELIATIGLLGMLATITITVAVRKINETKEKARDTMIESIELAAKQYVNDHGQDILEFNNNDNAYITLQTLVEKEYFTESLIDPTTKKSLPLTNEVYVTREESGEIITNYNINQRKDPKLTLIGSYNEYIEVGKEYIEKGVIAKSITGSDVSSSVTIKGTVDTTMPNTYKIIYELGNIKITRNVIVYSKNISSEEILKASTYIERLYKTNNYQNDELYNPKVTYEGKEYDTGIRYAGSNPNNYVYFNCDDKDSNNVSYGEKDYDYTSSCEIWRIIGVFEVEDENGNQEKRVKLVREPFIEKMSYNSDKSTINAGEGINQWGESTYEDGTYYEGAELMIMLNGYYIGKNNSCTYCDWSNQENCTNDCTNKIKQLSNVSVSLIEEVLWNLGAQRWDDPLLLSKMYYNERGTLSGRICLPENMAFDSYMCTDQVARTTSWVGKIGLIYLSDYGYASTDLNCANDILYTNSTCKNNNWLYTSGEYWTLTPRADEMATCIWNVGGENIATSSNASRPKGVRPSLYLKSSIKIKGGNGSSTSPYILA